MENKYIKEKIEELKKDTKPVDGLPLLKFLMDSKDKITDEEREVILRCISKSNMVVGEKLLMRAFYEKLMTEEEWKNYKIIGFKLLDICPILQAHFVRKDNNNERAIIVTASDNIVYRYKDILTKKFNIEIKTIKEATIDMIKSQSKIQKQIKRFEEYDKE